MTYFTAFLFPYSTHYRGSSVAFVSIRLSQHSLPHVICYLHTIEQARQKQLPAILAREPRRTCYGLLFLTTHTDHGAEMER